MAQGTQKGREAWRNQAGLELAPGTLRGKGGLESLESRLGGGGRAVDRLRVRLRQGRGTGSFQRGNAQLRLRLGAEGDSAGAREQQGS